MGSLFIKEDLISVVDYSISLLKRINAELNLVEDIPTIKNISLVGIKIDFLDESIRRALSESLRASDGIFVYNDLVIMILFGTPKEGAISLANQLKEFFGKNASYTVATYPEDGESAQELLNSFKIMMKLKLNLDFYGV